MALQINGLDPTYSTENYVSVNGHESSLTSVLYGVPQGSALGPLLFLIYINYPNQAIKFCKVHHFADDTNLLHFNKSVAKLNKLDNLDMKNLTVWLNVNKISLNVEKTERVILKHQRKNLTQTLKLNLIENNFILLNLLHILVLRLTKI